MGMGGKAESEGPQNRALRRARRRERKAIRREDRVLRRLGKGEFWDKKDEFWAKSKVEQAAILDTGVRRHQGMKRRLVLGLLGGTVAAGVIGEKLDAFSGDINWKETTSRLLRLNECSSWFPLNRPKIKP